MDAIAAELGVDYVLEGSVRGDDETIRVTAQLIQVSDQSHLWAETYDRDPSDLLAIQADVARRVAASLTLELLPDDRDALARAATSVTGAYDEYLLGRYHWNRFNGDAYRRAVQHFERALAMGEQAVWLLRASLVARELGHDARAAELEARARELDPNVKP